MIAWAEKGLWVFLGAGFLFFGLRTVKKARSSLREVLETSLEATVEEEKAGPVLTLEEEVLQAAKKNTELAGRTLRRWLYESAAKT
jgi:hypothetical protein